MNSWINAGISVTSVLYRVQHVMIVYLYDSNRREFASTQVDPELDSIDRMGLLQALQKIHREVQVYLYPPLTLCNNTLMMNVNE
jgi:hypothetical protein